MQFVADNHLMKMSTIMDEDMDCSHIAEYAINIKVDVDEMRATLNKRSCNGEIDYYAIVTYIYIYIFIDT